MAFSPLRSKTHHRSRTLSVPSKSHPTVSQFESNLSVVRASEATSCSLSSMENRVNGLQNLYNNVDDLLLLPHTQQIISQESQEKWVDQILDGHIRLLDACSSAKDLISNMKHEVEDLLSSLRRKDEDGIQCYLNSRRKPKKGIQKSLKDLRSFRSKQNVLFSEKDDETRALVSMLKEAESVTISMFESLLSYLMGTKIHTRSSGWSLVSKLVLSKKLSNDSYEFEKVDFLLQASQPDEELVNHLNEMDGSIQVLEEKLECLFRKLIKIRVFLLNILNH